MAFAVAIVGRTSRLSRFSFAIESAGRLLPFEDVTEMKILGTDKRTAKGLLLSELMRSPTSSEEKASSNSGSSSKNWVKQSCAMQLSDR